MRMLVILTAAVACGAPKPPCTPKLRARLVGCVRDALTGAPATGVSIYVTGPDDIELGGSITDDAGEWGADLPGAWFVITAACGHREERRNYRIGPRGPRYVVPTIVIDCTPSQGPPEHI